MILTAPANHSKSQTSNEVIHFHLLNCSDMALPSMFLTSNFHLENVWVVLTRVHGIVAWETALPLISPANDLYQGNDWPTVDGRSGMYDAGCRSPLPGGVVPVAGTP